MAGTTSAPTRKREATQHAILEAASALIAERGIDGFTLSDVAKRGAINRALIYHYFHDRDNLILEAIRHIVGRYEETRPAVGPDYAGRSIRMHIEHPEIGRFFFQLLLTGRPLPRLSRRLLTAVGDLEAIKAERAPGSSFDPLLSVISAWLAQLSWSFAREEIARLMGISVEEADERFIAQLRRASAANMQTLADNIG